MTGNTSTQRLPSYLEYKGKYTGILGWILSTDHKRIALLYLYSQLFFFLAGLVMGIFMKLELIAPGQQIMGPQAYNALFTVHGLTMIFLFIIPGLAASFGNFMIPIMIGAKDVAFPKLNLFSWYLFIAGAVIILIGVFSGDGPPDTGWTFYAPYSLKTNTNVVLSVFGAFVLGFSSILTGLNFIVTIHRMRAPGMGFFRMPLFIWSLYGTAWIQLLATPVVGITFLMVVADRLLDIGFFDPAKAAFFLPGRIGNGNIYEARTYCTGTANHGATGLQCAFYSAWSNDDIPFYYPRVGSIFRQFHDPDYDRRQGRSFSKTEFILLVSFYCRSCDYFNRCFFR